MLNLRRKHSIVAIIFLFLVCLLICVFNFNLCSLPTKVEKASIVRIVDGDTISVNLNNKEQKVRLLGINAPESVNPNHTLNTDAGKSSSNYLKSLIKAGDQIWLEDDPQQDNKDKYQRLLRYVWLSEPSNNLDNMVNYLLVRNGYAETNYYGHDRAKYIKQFKQAEWEYKESLDFEIIDRH